MCPMWFKNSYVSYVAKNGYGVEACPAEPVEACPAEPVEACPAEPVQTCPAELVEACHTELVEEKKMKPHRHIVKFAEPVEEFHVSVWLKNYIKEFEIL